MVSKELIQGSVKCASSALKILIMLKCNVNLFQVRLRGTKVSGKNFKRNTLRLLVGLRTCQDCHGHRPAGRTLGLIWLRFCVAPSDPAGHRSENFGPGSCRSPDLNIQAWLPTWKFEKEGFKKIVGLQHGPESRQAFFGLGLGLIPVFGS